MCPWGPNKAEGRCSRPVTIAWCSHCSSCCCPMTSLSIPSRSYSGWLLSSSWCSSCWLGQPPIPQVQRDHHPHSCVLCPQHLPSCLGHELTLEKLQPLCLDRWTSNTICIPETSSSAILLLLQTNRCETGRSSLLPGLFMAAQGVHTSPKVTASCHTDGCLSFLTEATFMALWGGVYPMHRKQCDFRRTGSDHLCLVVKKEDLPSCKLKCFPIQALVHNPPWPPTSVLPLFLSCSLLLFLIEGYEA